MCKTQLLWENRDILRDKTASEQSGVGACGASEVLEKDSLGLFRERSLVRWWVCEVFGSNRR
jgi:hypothetical protein